MPERLDLKVQRPTPERLFAAAQLRELAEVFSKKADKVDPSGDDPVAFAWIQASARCSSEARVLDNDEPFKVRIKLFPPEAWALSDFMDHHNDASYGGHWRAGRSGAIDWTTFELVVDAGADAGGHIPEAISWMGIGSSPIDPLLRSVGDKILAVARPYRDAARRRSMEG